MYPCCRAPRERLPEHSRATTSGRWGSYGRSDLRGDRSSDRHGGPESRAERAGLSLARMAATGVFLGVTTGGAVTHSGSVAWLFPSFASAAQAAPPPAIAPAPGVDEVLFSSAIKSSLRPHEEALTISYLKNGREIVLARVPLGDKQRLMIPAGIPALIVSLGRFDQIVPLSGKHGQSIATVQAQVTTEPTAAGDVEWVLGSPRRGAVKTLVVRATASEPASSSPAPTAETLPP